MVSTPWMAGAKAAAEKLEARLFARHMDERREEFRVYRAEARACGYETETFDEWLLAMDPEAAKRACPDALSPKDAAMARMAPAGMSLSDACYYGDCY